MEEYRKYFNDLVEHNFYELVITVDAIKSIVSNNNEANYNDSILTDFINHLNKRLKTIDEALVNLPTDTIPYNKLFNLLYTINFKIAGVEEFLNKYDYINRLQLSYNRIKQKLYRGMHLSEEAVSILETFIMRNDHNLDLDFLCNYYIKKCLNKEDNIEIGYKFFRELIKNKITKESKKYYQDSTCIILDIPSKIKERGFESQNSTFKNNVVLLEDDIKDLYYSGSKYVIYMMNHELSILRISSEINKGEVKTPLYIDATKDYILSKQDITYYQDNYPHLIFEQLAKIDEIKNTSEYLEKLGMHINNDEVENINIDIEESIKDRKRKYKKKDSYLDILFNNYIINRSYLLTEYPQLEEEYKIIDGKVILKDKEELNENYQNYLNKDNNFRSRG